MKTKLLFVAALAGVLALGPTVQGRVAAAAPTLCPPNPTGNVNGDLEVTAGATCTLTGVRVTGDVLVDAGATLIATRSAIGGDVNATNARRLTIEGVSAGGNLIINGTFGSGETSRICGSSFLNVNIAHIGDGDEVDFGDDGKPKCQGNRVGASIGVIDNGFDREVEVDGNSITSDLVIARNNGPLDISGNQIGRDFSCDTPPNSDGDPNVPKNDETRNNVGRTRTCFPTPNP
jgi:hypothetical protein